jgi:hypothetical protein
MTTIHPNDELLETYALGRLSEAEAAGLEEHLIACGACRDRLVETEDFIAAFRQGALETAPAAAKVLPFRLPRRTIWAPMAVAAALLLGIFAYQPHGNREGEPAVLVLQPLRGPEAGAAAEAGRPLVLLMDVPSETAAGYDAEIVDSDGGTVLRRAARLRDGRLVIDSEGLSRGDYWVRLYERRPVPEQMEEYRLQVR